MPLHEITTRQLTLYKQELRKAKDDYTARKVQKDRVKIKTWFDALLREKEAVIFYKKDGVEQQALGTRIAPREGEIWGDIPEVPPVIEIINGAEVPVDQHIIFWSLPSRETIVVHVDDITKFIVTSEGLYELANKVRYGEA